MAKFSMDEQDEPITIQFNKVIKETDKAILFELDTGKEVWIPKSQIEDQTEESIDLPWWLAKKIGAY